MVGHARAHRLLAAQCDELWIILPGSNTDIVCRVKVMDDDAFQKDRLLGWLCFRFDRFPQGLRLFPLKGGDSKPNGSALLVDSRLVRQD